MDQVAQIVDNNLAPSPGVTTDQQKNAQQMSENMQAGLTCYTTSCGGKCKKGTNAVAHMSGQPGQLSTNDRCAKGEYRTLCCDDGTFIGSCKWRGFRGVGLSCINGCDDGETEVVTDTNHHEKNGDQTCTGGLQSYCCKGFKPAPSKHDIKRQAEDTAKAAAEAAAANAALDLAAKAFCRVAVPAVLAPLELAEDLIPIVGKSCSPDLVWAQLIPSLPQERSLILQREILDIAEIAATPALINLCVKGVEKEGKAEFKVFGKKHTLSLNRPTDKPSSTRPPESSHSKAKTSSDSCPAPAKAVKRMPKACRRITVRETTRTEYVSGNVIPRTCDAAVNEQPCMHYNSVVRRVPEYGQIVCYTSSPSTTRRAAVTAWSSQHAEGWHKAINPQPPGGCEADIWPPGAFWQGNAAPQWIRYNPGNDNRRAGQLWNRLCPKLAERTFRENDPGRWITSKNRNVETITIRGTMIYTRSTMSMHFAHIAAGVIDVET